MVTRCAVLLDRRLRSLSLVRIARSVIALHREGDESSSPKPDGDELRPGARRHEDGAPVRREPGQPIERAPRR